jgi:predicted nucleic acid-binding protein
MGQRMKLFLDACAIIYCLESKGEHGQNSRSLITSALKNDAQLIVSRLSFLECRVLPLKTKNENLLKHYNQFFNANNLQIIELTADVVSLAADLRAKYPIKTPDALQMACALKSNAEIFVTGDKRLAVIEEINIQLV